MQAETCDWTDAVYGKLVTRESLGSDRDCGLEVWARHQWICEWLSDDRQASMWMGVGVTADAALADAQREGREQELEGGSWVVHEILD